MREQKLPLLMYRGLLDSDRHIKRFKDSEYMAPWLLASSVLDTEVLYESPIHGLGHIERVMLLGALLAKAEELSERETRLLLFACSYHDTGRRNDARDSIHGYLSAGVIREKKLFDIPGDFTEQEMAIINTAVTTHSMHDTDFEYNCVKFCVNDENLPACANISFCLKDADNLDRVRLGDLDVNYLRHASARRLVPTAEFLYKIYNEY